MKLLVIGDRIVDRSFTCQAERLCPEAPVPVLTIQRRETTDGGAALVDANLRSLGFSTVPVYGSESLKERYFVGNHLVVRIDDDHVARSSSSELFGKIRSTLPSVDAIIISDYCKGTVDYNIARLCVGSGKPCFVDTKNSHIEWFEGQNVTLFPNEREYSTHVKGKEALFGSVIWKRGPLGCVVFSNEYRGVAVPARKRAVADVTGAGDCHLSAFLWATAHGMDALAAAQVANDGAGLSVEKLGTYVLTEKDLKT